jgi:hypothetical protein
VVWGRNYKSSCKEHKEINILNLYTNSSVTLKNLLHGLSPRANYTDRATAACRWSGYQLLRIEGPRGQGDGSLWPNSRFSRQEPLLLYQVAPQSYSRGWVDPVPDLPHVFFLMVPGSNPGLRICSQELWPLDHRGIRNTTGSFFLWFYKSVFTHSLSLILENVSSKNKI